MDILDHYLKYEAWTLRYFIVRCGELTPAQLHQPFDIGPGNLYDTIAHIVSNIEVWTALMRERPLSPSVPLPEEIDACLERFDTAMADFTACAHHLTATQRLEDIYMDVLDDPPEPKSFGGTLLHVLTHTTVHRWEMQHMLQRLGVTDLIEGDALSWEWRARHNAL